MQCPRHPEKRAIAVCRDCGAEFCIECVKETDQSNYCPDCYRRKLKEMTERFSSGATGEGAREEGVTPREEIVSDGKEQAAVTSGVPGRVEDEAPGGKPKRKFFPGVGKRSKGQSKEGAVEPAPVEGMEGGEEKDFLARGPDEDFSDLRRDKRRQKRERKAGRKERRKKTAAVPAGEKAEAPSDKGEAAAEEGPDSDEDLLQDVVSTLLKPEVAEAGVTAAAGKAVGESAGRARARREERVERWSFLAQPRSSQYTMLADKWWKSAIFIALMLLLGAVLWAVPNTYLIPGDMEYGIHAVALGIIIGLFFWWKAGKAHSTKLAVQAALTTLFALLIGEFLHWFLVIMKHSAFRTIFFDLISFKFIWENGPEIMEKTIEAMFPWAFTWILILPTLVALVIGYGMPPIPEIFFQIGRALKGEPPKEKEAGRGMEG